MNETSAPLVTGLPPLELGYSLAGLISLGILLSLTAIIPVIVLLVRSVRDSEIPLEMFLLNYSISGLLRLLNIAIFGIVTMVTRDWVFCSVVCTGTGFLNALFRYATSAQLCILLFDRYICLNYFKHYEEVATKSRAIMCSILPWIIAASIAAIHAATPNVVQFQQGAYRCDVTPDAGLTSILVQSECRFAGLITIIALLVIVSRIQLFNDKGVFTATFSTLHQHIRTARNLRLGGQISATRVVGLMAVLHLPAELLSLTLSVVGAFTEAATVEMNAAILCLEALSAILIPLPFYVVGDRMRGAIVDMIKCGPGQQVENCEFKYINHCGKVQAQNPMRNNTTDQDPDVKNSKLVAFNKVGGDAEKIVGDMVISTPGPNGGSPMMTRFSISTPGSAKTFDGFTVRDSPVVQVSVSPLPKPRRRMSVFDYDHPVTLKETGNGKAANKKLRNISKISRSGLSPKNMFAQTFSKYHQRSMYGSQSEDTPVGPATPQSAISSRVTMRRNNTHQRSMYGSQSGESNSPVIGPATPPSVISSCVTMLHNYTPASFQNYTPASLQIQLPVLTDVESRLPRLDISQSSLYQKRNRFMSQLDKDMDNVVGIGYNQRHSQF